MYKAMNHIVNLREEYSMHGKKHKITKRLNIGAVFLIISFLFIGCQSKEDMNYQKVAVEKEDTNTKILLSDNGSFSEDSNVKIEGNIITLSKSGTYVVEGTLDDGQIVVDGSKEKFTLILNGTNITSKDSATIYVANAADVTIITETGSENTLTSIGEFQSINDNNVDGVIFSKEDLIFNGGGTLNIVTTSGNGIVGKDSLIIEDGIFNISTSGKGIEVNDSIVINGGTLVIHTEDDAIQSEGTLDINGGNLTISSGDDGMHADGDLVIKGGSIDILKSYEGIEGSTVTISGGKISLVASDDGINAAGGSDNDNTSNFWSKNPKTSDTSKWILIEGGEIYIYADGDGIDSNGELTITGGIVYVDGPTNNGNGALDYDTTAYSNGGITVAVGSSQMASGFSTSSTQPYILYNLSQNQNANTLITLKDSEETIVLEYAPRKSFSSVLISIPQLEVGKTYTLTIGTEEVLIEMTSINYQNGGTGGMTRPGRGGIK